MTKKIKSRDPDFYDAFKILLGARATSLSDASIYDPVATPDSTTTYTVQVQSIEGCLATDTVTIYIDHRRQIFMPTAFTPNGDGKNDYFYPMGINMDPDNYSFQVYNNITLPLSFFD